MDKRLLNRVRKQTWYHKFPRALPIALFVLVCLVGGLVDVAIQRSEQMRRAAELDRDAGELAAALQRRASESAAVLRAAATLIATRPDATQADFSMIAEDLHANDGSYGAVGMSWAKRVEADAVPAFEKALQQRDPTYHVWPRPRLTGRAIMSVMFITPQSPDMLRNIGFDMYSERTRRETMNRAQRLNQPVASAKLVLAIDFGRTPRAGFLIAMPVFAGDNPKQPLLGFVYSGFRVADLLASASRLINTRAVNIAIYDGAVAPELLLASHSVPGIAGKTITQRVQVANRSWIVSVTEARPFRLSQLARLAILSWGILAILLSTITWLVIRSALLDRDALVWQSQQVAIRETLTRELNHRVKNTLANVLSIAMVTGRRSADLEEFLESFAARVRALSATHDILTENEWSVTQIGEVVEAEVAPYYEGTEGRITVNGPDIRVAPKDALSLGLAVHELISNAVKYGALSSESGQVQIAWWKTTENQVTVLWREEGGPPVDVPDKRGFGRDLLEQIIADDLKGEVSLIFAATGVECRLSFPIRQPVPFALKAGEAG